MVHLSHETLSELLDGGPAPAAEEHLAGCPMCQAELEALRGLRAELRELPELEPPPELWARIEAQLPVARRRGRSHLRWPGLIALQVAAMAAVFVIGIGLGRVSQSGESPTDTAAPQVVVAEASPSTLAEAMGEVRRLGAQYDAAVANLQRLARQEGTQLPSLTEQRLAGLDMLVEASRTALAAEPADPVLNAYLFAALEERDAVLQQIRDSEQSGSGILWR
jgi:hypothetical protein